MRDSERFRAAVLAALLAAGTAAVFAPAARNGFVPYDDPVMVRDNAALRAGLSQRGLRWAFTTVHGANWIPLTWTSYLVDAELDDLSPGGVHLGSVLLHVTSALLLFFALRRMTAHAPASAFVAGVFALHPIQVESVAWAAERKGVLAGTCWMLALWLYARGGRARSLGVAGAMALGLLAKGVLVTLPFALLLLDFWPLRRLSAPGSARLVDAAALRGALREKAALFALSAAGCVATFVAQRAGGATAPLEALSLAARLANVPVAYARYLGKLLVPVGFAPFYPHPESGLGAGVVVASIVLLLSLTVLAAARARSAPWLIVGWLWFFGVLVPMIGVVQVGSQALADRYAYLPIVGVALALGFAGAELAARGGVVRARALASLGALVLTALALLAAQQRERWADGRTLFEHALRVTGDGNWVAHEQLGAALLDVGDAERGIAELRRALALRPRSPRLLNNVAWLLATHPDERVRQPALAVQLAKRAVEASGGADPDAHDTLAAALAAAGRFDEAARAERTALELARARGAPQDAFRQRLAAYEAGRMPDAPPADAARAVR